MHSIILVIPLVTFLIAPKSDLNIVTNKNHLQLVFILNIMHLSIIMYFHHHRLFIMQQLITK